MARKYDHKEQALRICASYKDFDGDLAKWKDSFYHLWRHQLTWSFAYTVELNENRETGVFVSLLIRPAFKDSVLGAMEDLGYRKIVEYEEAVGIVDSYGLDEDIGELVVEW